jgi:hypothetical protein
MVKVVVERFPAPALGSACFSGRCAVTDVLPAEDRPSRLRAIVAKEPASDGCLVGTALTLHRLCRSVVRVVPAAGAAVSLMTDGGLTGIVAASGPRWRDIEELQFILGEGPAWDAFGLRAPVLAPDLRAWGETRWPGYCSVADEHGVRAVFALPLCIGSGRLGVLDIYRHRPGLLSAAELGDALILADVATGMLLDGQAGVSEGSAPPGLAGALASGFLLYQAQGMLMVQLGVPLRDALARLRAYAYANDRTLGEVARDVVAGTLGFERDER